MTWRPKMRGATLVLLLLAGMRTGLVAAEPAGVAIVRTAGWAPGGTVRDGAAELLVLMEIARLRQETGRPGLIAVGDRRGLFPAGAEAALHDAVLRGVPVVKLATGGRVLPAPHGLFLDGGNLSATEAAAVLGRCLKLYGALPVTAAAAGSSDAAPPGLRERLNLFQHEFTLAASPRLAVR